MNHNSPSPHLFTRHFFSECIPPKTTSQQKGLSTRGHRPFFFKKKKTIAAEDTIICALTPFIPPTPLDGPIALLVEVFFPLLKSDKPNMVYYHDTKPDYDNLAKTIGDSLQLLGFIANDSRIVDGHVRKFRRAKTGYGITLSQLSPITQQEG